jgi:hypothetical protein
MNEEYATQVAKASIKICHAPHEGRLLSKKQKQKRRRIESVLETEFASDFAPFIYSSIISP